MPNVVTNPALPYTQTGNTCVVFTASPATSGDVTSTGTVTANGITANHSATGITVGVGVTLNGSIINQGTINANKTGVLLVDQSSISGSIINNGTIAAQTGIVVTGAHFTGGISTAGGIVSGGITNAGNLSCSGAAIDVTTESAPTTIENIGGTITGAIDLSSLGDALIISGGTVNGDIHGLNPSLDTVTFALGADQTFTYSTGRIDGVTTILDGGTLEFANTAVVSNVKFASANATLQLDVAPTTSSSRFQPPPQGLQGNIVDAVSGDNIDLRFQAFAAGDHAVWQQQNRNGVVFGTLSVETSSGTVLTTLTFDGTYTSANFVVASDNHGGTLIEVVNPPPPAGTTAVMIMNQASTGNYEIYDIGHNSVLAAFPLTNVSSPWSAVDVGGFDGSDTSDLLLRNGSTGAFELFDVSGNNASGPVQLGAVGLEWTVAGFGDFSGNPGETDMLLRNTNATAQHPNPTGAFTIYDISNNMVTSASPMGAVGLEWQFLGSGDFSSNPGETDMLLRDVNNGALEVYNISHNTLVGATSMGAVGLEWQFVGVGDFSGNAGETDMLMRDVNNGALEVYNIHNDQIVSAQAMGAVGLEWSLVGVGDFSGSPGETDMLLRDANNGAFEIYDISHDNVVSASAIGAVGTDWQTVGIAAFQSPAAAVASSATSQLDSVASGVDTLMSSKADGAAPAAELSAPLWAAGNATPMVAGSLFQHA